MSVFLVHFTVTMVTALSEAIDKAIQIKRDGHQLDVWEAHHRVKGMYNWCNIAERTEKVYNSVIRSHNRSLVERVHKHYKRGPIAGIVYVILLTLLHLVHWIVAWLRPARLIDIVPQMTTTRNDHVIHQ